MKIFAWIAFVWGFYINREFKGTIRNIEIHRQRTHDFFSSGTVHVVPAGLKTSVPLMSNFGELIAGQEGVVLRFRIQPPYAKKQDWVLKQVQHPAGRIIDCEGLRRTPDPSEMLAARQML